jgi:O-antigen/teichoic acid export membrane protein
VLSVYVWASIPVFLNIASTQYLIAENKTTVALLRTLAGSVANVALNIVLIPRYGGVGAAWASLISYAVTTIFIVAVPGLRGQAAMMLRSLNPWSVFQLFRNRIPRTAP